MDIIHLTVFTLCSCTVACLWLIVKTRRSYIWCFLHPNMHYFTEILREFSLQAIQEWKVDFNLMNILDDYYLTTVSVPDLSLNQLIFFLPLLKIFFTTKIWLFKERQSTFQKQIICLFTFYMYTLHCLINKYKNRQYTDTVYKDKMQTKGLKYEGHTMCDKDH